MIHEGHSSFTDNVSMWSFPLRLLSFTSPNALWHSKYNNNISDFCYFFINATSAFLLSSLDVSWGSTLVSLNYTTVDLNGIMSPTPRSILLWNIESTTWVPSLHCKFFPGLGWLSFLHCSLFCVHYGLEHISRPLQCYTKARTSSPLWIVPF